MGIHHDALAPSAQHAHGLRGKGISFFYDTILSGNNASPKPGAFQTGSNFKDLNILPTDVRCQYSGDIKI
jgi:hypothetical protein